jgi:hypothetical protein
MKEVNEAESICTTSQKNVMILFCCEHDITEKDFTKSCQHIVFSWSFELQCLSAGGENKTG